ncbi:hypothetical protein HELRODRAFT_159191 [Helobdella robusta]|uniref:Uncharacterized protein n=1 Tax=Helobdella robusta TaxID=6412 RepID=T1ENQ3_HELRO|nr:hypothetical protein HELRODRAFT_159191 [Helobdella robusta]ESO12621.1 hypothetical protein HELRODRAFT_159191 [Helobdella robusta]
MVNDQAMGTSVSKKFNLWRHVKRNHPKIYDELVKQKDENDKAASDKKRGNENDATPSKKKIKTVQENMSTYFTSSKVTITMDANTVTRWGSTYAMLDRLLFFKDYCEQVVAAAGTKDLELSKDEWNEVKNIRDVLEKPNITTVALQAADLTPGMFMKEWCKLEKCLEENGEYVALGILSSMRKRKEKLLHNTHFLAGVYVDARYRILLNKSDKIKAREGLADIQLRLKRKKVFDSAKESTSVNVSQPTCDLNFISEDDDDDFENELDRRENTRKISMKSHIENDCEIQRHFEEDCKAIEDVGRIKVNVFEAIAHYPDRIRQSSRIAAIKRKTLFLSRLNSEKQFLLKNAFLLGSFSGLSLRSKDDINTKPFYKQIVDLIKVGKLQQHKKEFKDSEDTYHKALALIHNHSKSVNVDETEISQAKSYVLDSMADLAFAEQKFDKAQRLYLETMQELINVQKFAPDDDSILEISLKLSMIYVVQGEYDLAELGYKYCLDILEKKTNGENDAVSIDTLALYGMSLDSYGKYLFYVKRFSDSLLSLKKSLAIAEKLLDHENPQLSVMYNDIGVLSIHRKELDLALEYLELSLKNAKEAHLSIIYYNIGEVYFLQNNYEIAATKYENALKHCDKSSIPEIKTKIMNARLKLVSVIKISYEECLIGQLESQKNVYNYINDSIDLCHWHPHVVRTCLRTKTLLTVQIWTKSQDVLQSFFSVMRPLGADNISFGTFTSLDKRVVTGDCLGNHEIVTTSKI